MYEIKEIYRVHGLKDICENCCDKANKFINYWGKKKKSDLADLKGYLNSGKKVKNKFNAQMNGGYY